MTSTRNAAIDDPTNGLVGNPATGLVLVQSSYGPVETAERMEAAVAARGMTVVTRIDHAAAAAQVGLNLRPTLVLIFGNPVAGTPLMQAFPTVAIDLPLKALVWQSDDGRSWLAYNDPARLVERHAVTIAKSGIAEILERMSRSLASAAQAASTGPSA